MSSTTMSPYSSVWASSFKPGYSVSKLPVARKLVPPGMAKGAMTSWLSSSTMPTAYSGGTSESYMPSIMASLVGCSFHTTTAEEWANTIMAQEVTMPTTAVMRMVFMANSALRPLSIYQPATAMATNAPMMSSASTVWV